MCGSSRRRHAELDRAVQGRWHVLCRRALPVASKAAQCNKTELRTDRRAARSRGTKSTARSLQEIGRDSLRVSTSAVPSHRSAARPSPTGCSQSTPPQTRISWPPLSDRNAADVPEMPLCRSAQRQPASQRRRGSTDVSGAFRVSGRRIAFAPVCWLFRSGPAAGNCQRPLISAKRVGRVATGELEAIPCVKIMPCRASLSPDVRAERVRHASSPGPHIAEIVRPRCEDVA